MYSLISWFGGKNKMASKIITLMPRHKSYIEVFGGGGHILLNKKRCGLEVYNDVNSGLVSLFRTLSVEKHGKKLKERLELTPYSREEFEYCKERWEKGLVDNSKEILELKEKFDKGEISEELFQYRWVELDSKRFQKVHYKIKETEDKLNNQLKKEEITQEEYLKAWDELEEHRIEDQIERARMFYVLCTQSFSAGLESWKSERRMRTGRLSPMIKRYLDKIDKDLDFAIERLRTVQIENKSYEYIIERYDDKNALFYLDPPYIHSTRGRAEEELEQQEGETNEEFDERIKNNRKKTDYHHELTDDMHVEFVERIMKLKGKVIVSGYDHPIYDPISEGNWRKVKLGDYAKSCQRSDAGQSKDVGEEFLWINFVPGT